jgi:hypothetical protein
MNVLRVFVQGCTALSFVKRAFFLAYCESKVVGLGRLQERADATEEDVWVNINLKNDYLEGIEALVMLGEKVSSSDRADYVFGRQMKLEIGYVGQMVSFLTPEHHPNQQSFASMFPLPMDLASITAKSLGCTITIADEQKEV